MKMKQLIRAMCILTVTAMIVALYKILKANPSTNITWNTLMASSVYSTLPIIVLFLSIKKHIVKGMVSGAIK